LDITQLESKHTPATQFNRASLAREYAQEHLTTDPGIIAVHFLPRGANDCAIRFVEVNTLIGDRTDNLLEPIDFGIDRGTKNEHRLFVLDVTPSQSACCFSRRPPLHFLCGR
jgi:hypothetical protein